MFRATESLNQVKTSAIEMAMKFGPKVSEINMAIVEAFRSRNIVIPFPQHEIRMVNAA